MRRPYPPEFRTLAVALVRASKPQTQTADGLGIHPVTLSKWIKHQRLARTRSWITADIHRVRRVGVTSETRSKSTARFVASPSDRTPPPSSLRTDDQRLPLVGAWSVNLRHAVVSGGARWR